MPGRIKHEEFAVAIEDDQHMNKVLALMMQIHNYCLTPHLALRRALEIGEIHLVWHHQTHALTRQPLGIEALLRWESGYELIPPD